jgi:hypothetical protein
MSRAGNLGYSLIGRDREEESKELPSRSYRSYRIVQLSSSLHCHSEVPITC